MGCLAGGAMALCVLCLPAGASAYEGEFAKFDYCPVSTPGVIKCLDSVTGGGAIVLGKKTTPIVNPVTLQGGYSRANEEHIAHLFPATNGETLTKTPQPVPGGLVGLVPPESAPPLVKAALALVLENGFTGVNATLELAKPAEEIELSNYNLLNESGVALRLPVKIHLENPFLGSDCYVGSDSDPLIWNLTTGTTSPSPPASPMTGKAGFTAVTESEELTELTENELVDNTWSAPKATGCGGALALLVDPIVDTTVGLPAEAGTNSALLKNTVAIATPTAVEEH